MRPYNASTRKKDRTLNINDIYRKTADQGPEMRRAAAKVAKKRARREAREQTTNV